ncbi:MAG: tRNA (adenosine(37)-N6)-threonylcarbamoyltransferase complex ATPase subunit type 1 TsaE [Bacteroidales bacterium]|nr:tRNA (adenosine(37)-N6)-threonylcarbamoyltransferase complex ATPase subunit type 1 TsaE [Bacteroidales bacterium]
MTEELIIKDLESLPSAAEKFLSLTGGHSLIAFYGCMGAGKTTFISALCRALGVRESEVASPTFAIVNEYATDSRDTVYHFDFYRITDPREALDIGLYDYLDSGCLCLMEWPENIEALLPEETLKVYIDVLPDGERKIHWEQ